MIDERRVDFSGISEVEDLRESEEGDNAAKYNI